MAVNFIARKCACGGKLEFNPAKKIWICKYCGTIVEREATFDRIQVDGIEGINDVVRQTLMDVADNKMDSAHRNLEDCERKNHKHVGTLIANISYNIGMISAAGSQEEARGYLDRVTVYAKRLKEEFPSIAEDEINLYEGFGEGASNIYANLLAVFDTLSDSGRVEYIASKLKPAEIFSEHANKSLLRISIKHQNYETVEAIVKNSNHIDRKYSLQEIMMHYPDTANKMEFIGILLNAQTAEALSRGFFEQYFKESKDSVETKTFVIGKLNETGLRCSAETIAKALYGQMDGYDTAKNVFSALYETKVSDQETESIFAFCLTESRFLDIFTAFLDALLEKDVFVKLNLNAVISFLEGFQIGVDEKIHVLQKMFRFELDGKTMDAIYNYYLNSSQDAAQDRMKVIEFLLTENCPISNNTVKNYIVHTNIDAGNKLSVVEMIFATGINKTYLGELLSEYLLESCDPVEIKDKISDCLIDKGFKVDSQVLTQYITSTDESADTKIHKAKRLIENGTQVRMDCLDQYILSLKQPTDFSEQIFNLLTGYHFTISFAAYSKFLLYCKDIDKARHNTKLKEVLTGDFNHMQATVSHNGESVVCNLLQAYVLVTTDHYDIVKDIVSGLSASRLKMNTEISVNGSTMKFKKYVGERKAGLSPLTLQICEENKMFSLF